MDNSRCITFLTVVILALTIILMWIGYVQVLNWLIDKEQKLKDSKPKNDKAIKKTMRIQKALIFQCYLFAGAVGTSLWWLLKNSCGQDPLFIWALALFTVSQAVHLLVFSYSYLGKLFQCYN